jgi:DNA-binding GntR family transcriptional regulator
MHSLARPRTPLREVLNMLSAKGLVNLPPNCGASAVGISRQEAAKLIRCLERSSRTPASSPRQDRCGTHYTHQEIA